MLAMAQNHIKTNSIGLQCVVPKNTLGIGNPNPNDTTSNSGTTSSGITGAREGIYRSSFELLSLAKFFGVVGNNTHQSIVTSHEWHV